MVVRRYIRTCMRDNEGCRHEAGTMAASLLVRMASNPTLIAADL